MKPESSIDPREINKFQQHVNDWWNLQGPLKTLHMINPVRLEYIQKHINLSGKSILDVGCGGGILTESMAKAGGVVQGLDAGELAIETAIAHAGLENLSIQYHCQTLETFQSEPFDVITCMEMLEHVPNPKLIIEHCARLLKPGGILFLSTINRTLTAYMKAVVMAEYILRLLPRQTHEYEKFIAPSELAKIARTMELEIVDIAGMDFNPVTNIASIGTDVSVNYFMVLRNHV